MLLALSFSLPKSPPLTPCFSYPCRVFSANETHAGDLLTSYKASQKRASETSNHTFFPLCTLPRMITSWGPSSCSKMSCNSGHSHLALRDVVLNNHLNTLICPCSDFTHQLLGQKHLLHFGRILCWRLSMEPSSTWLSLWLPTLPPLSSRETRGNWVCLGSMLISSCCCPMEGPSAWA